MSKWNTKVICTEVFKHLDNKGFKEGQTYEIKNGRLILPDGTEGYTILEGIDDLNGLYYAVFKEVTK